MKNVILALILCFNFYSYSQKIIQSKGKSFIIQKNKLQLEVGKKYKFQIGESVVHAQVKKVTKSKALLKTLKGKVPPEGSVYLVGESNLKSKRKSRSYWRGAKNFKRMRFYLGGSYSLMTLDSEVGVTNLDGGNTISINAGANYYVKPKLTVGAGISYGLSKEFDLMTSNPSGDYVASGSLLRMNFEVGYLIFKSARIFGGISFTDIPLSLSKNGNELNISSRGFGARVGLDYDLMISESFGLRPHISYSYSSLKEGSEKSSGDFAEINSISIIDAGISLVYAF